MVRRIKNATEKRVFEWLDTMLKVDVIHQFYATWCRNPTTNRILPFDIYIPAYNVAIEIDGPQHFNTIKRSWGSAKSIRERDVIKMQKCYENGVTIIRVPQELAALKTGTTWKGELMSYLTFLKTFKYAETPIYITGGSNCYTRHHIEFIKKLTMI